MINTPFVIQTIFCQIAGSYFSSQNIGVFYTIPPQLLAPYIKVSQISVLKQEQANPTLVAVELSLTIYTNGPENSQILSIIQALDTDVVALLNGASDVAMTVLVRNAYINNWKVNEIIERKCWSGTCNMVIIAGSLN